MSMLKNALYLSVPEFILIIGNSYALPYTSSPDRHTTLTTELESTPSYQIARMQFLPDIADDLGMSGRHFKSGYYTADNNCEDYPLTSCPDGWDCSECKTTNLQIKYKTVDCKTGYKNVNNKCVKTEDCSKYKKFPWLKGTNSSVCSSRQYSYQASLVETCDGISYVPCACPDNGNFIWNGSACVCKSGYQLNGTACVPIPEEDCSDFTLSVCPNNANCSSCGGKFKFVGCNDGYTQSGNQCLVKSNCLNIYDLTECPEHGKCSECGGKFFLGGCDYGFHTEGNICKEGCSSSYTLDSCPEHGTCDECLGKYYLKECDDGFVKCSKSCNKKLKYLFSDKTISENVESEKTPIGIVFDEERRLAVSLGVSGQHMWCTENFDIPDLPHISKQEEALSDFDGKSNSEKILAYSEANNKRCSPFVRASTYKTEGTNAGDWYIPASGELAILVKNVCAYEHALAEYKRKRNPNLTGSMSLLNCVSSTQCSEKMAWVQRQTSISCREKKYIIFASGIYDACYVLKY